MHFASCVDHGTYSSPLRREDGASVEPRHVHLEEKGDARFCVINFHEFDDYSGDKCLFAEVAQRVDSKVGGTATLKWKEEMDQKRGSGSAKERIKARFDELKSLIDEL